MSYLEPRLDDGALARRMARGDSSAFGELMQRYEPGLARFVRRRLHKDRDMAEDVLQEVLLQVHRSAATFAGRAGFRTWLYGLARNVCRHEARKLRREPDRCAEPADHLTAIPDVRPGPLDGLVRDELANALRRAVDQLPPQQRLALLLRDWEERSYADIAGALGVPVGTVRSRLHNARAQVADRLGHLWKEPTEPS